MVQERPVRVERRLAAILAADVAGYSRLMHHAEEATHAKLSALLTEVVHPAIADHGGRIVKNTGDGFLAEFPSAVQAVRAAAEFQARVNHLAVGDTENKRLAFRVGINVGDVIIEPHDVFGDGVNIAARLESIAEPGGICISSSAYDHIRGKVGVEFADLGEQNLKNIASPVRAYTAVQDGRNSATRPDGVGSTIRPPPRLSIVVLPFANLSGEKQQDDFVDAITENLTTDISRLPDYFVISCKTAFAFKGKIVDARQIGRELGVRYVLEGSVQSGTDRLRVNAKLIDTETGAHLWAERFDKPRADPFDMQDEITARLARAMDVQLVAAETRRLEREEPKELDAVDLALRGWTAFSQKVSVAGAREARSIFEEALRVDNTNVDVLMGLVETHLWEVNAYMSQARAEQVRLAEAAMFKASQLTPLTSRMHFCRAALLIALRAPERALREIELAMSLDPDLPYVHMRAGWVKIFLGRGEETEGHVTTAMRLSPRDPMLGNWYAILGLADLQLGRLDMAVDRLRKAIEIAPNNELPYFHLAAALALQDRKSEAAQASEMGGLLAPIFRIGKCRVEVQSGNPVFLLQRNRIYEGMERAGIPE
ncbi:adenylate/guanylate cyclase domain-containing protein [Bradyrhizobium sp. P5_C11_2]